jgi:hypothetical protein
VYRPCTDDCVDRPQGLVSTADAIECLVQLHFISVMLPEGKPAFVSAGDCVSCLFVPVAGCAGSGGRLHLLFSCVACDSTVPTAVLQHRLRSESFLCSARESQ